MPDVTVIETVYVMESFYRFTRSEVASAIQLVIGRAVFDIDRVLWSDIMGEYLQHPKLSVTDIYLVADATRNKAGPLLSFDKKLVAQLGAQSPG